MLASGLIMMNYTESLSEQFEFIILLATLSTLVPYLVCSLCELMISVTTGRKIAENQSFKVVTLASVGFLYSIWAIYGAGRDVVFWGFLLLVMGLPIYVWLRWQASISTSKEMI